MKDLPLIPTVVNIRTCNPKFGQPGDIRIDRSTKFGNPFPMRSEEERDTVIKQYEEFAEVQMVPYLSDLVGSKRLGCWCKPKSCHGDILVKMLVKHGLCRLPTLSTELKVACEIWHYNSMKEPIHFTKLVESLST